MHFSAAFLVSALAANAMAKCTKGNPQHPTHTKEHVAAVTHTYNQPGAYHEPVYVPVVTTTFIKVHKTKTAKAVPHATYAPPSNSYGLTKDQTGALDAHNKAREEVGNKPLEWDSGLASDALSWAQHLASIGQLVHSGAEGQGENIYMQSDSANPLTNAVNSFLEEKASYSPGESISGSNYMNFGHYTQCVWKDTTVVGMASAVASDGSTWVVARYKKPGNFMGETPY